MADTVNEKLSDERLSLYASDNCPLYQHDEVPGDWIAEVVSMATELLSHRTAPAEPVAWQSMDTAPLDGKHCILAVPEPSGFIYSVQGAYQDGKWNAVHRNDVVPIAWMPNIRLPDAMRAALLAALGGHHG